MEEGSPPVHIERQVLFLLALQKGRAKDARPCWDIQNCSADYNALITAKDNVALDPLSGTIELSPKVKVRRLKGGKG